MLVLLLVTAGSALRIVGLNEGMWVDEIETLRNYIHLPVAEIVQNYQSRNNHILYSVLAHFSATLFGESAWALRLPAALAGIATIPATYYLGRQLASRNEAFLVTAFLVASYHHVWFSQNARGYAGLLLGAVLLSILFIRLLANEKPGFGTALAYAICAALTIWIHLSGALVVAAHGLVWLIWVLLLVGRQKTGIGWAAPAALALSVVFALALYAPVLTQLVPKFLPAQAPPSELVSAIAAPASAVADRLAWESSEWLLAELWGGAQRAIPGGWIAILSAALAMGAGAWSYLRQGFLPAAMLLVPAPVVIAAVTQASVLYPRFLVVCLVFFLLIAVRGGFFLARAVAPVLTVRQVTAIGLSVALVTALKVPAAWMPKQDFAGAAAFVNERRVAGDVVVCGPTTYFALHAMLGMDCQQAGTATELAALERAHSRTWFLYAIPAFFQYSYPDLWDKLQSDYEQVESVHGSLNGGEIVIMLSTARH